VIPFALFVIAALLLLPASAAADGLPAVGIDAQPLGIPGGQVVYVTERAGHDTRLIEKARYGGAMRERTVPGSFSVPAVAYDGSPSGLSADGRKLVLISPRKRFPRKRTTFAVVDSRRLTVRRQISLRGDFSFDAISPDGRTMYLIEYAPRARDFGKYAVRAYDLRARRLLRAPVVDPDEADEPMTGLPVTRVPAPDGRWQYTLYADGKHSFVHALDTSRRTAVCIDLDHGDVWGSSLALRGHRLDVIGRDARVVAGIDTRTHELIAPRRRSRRSEDAGTSWLPLALPTAALLLLAAATRRRMLKRSAAEPITEAWEPPSDRHAPTA
jgi:hypothetical protein